MCEWIRCDSRSTEGAVFFIKIWIKMSVIENWTRRRKILALLCEEKFFISNEFINPVDLNQRPSGSWLLWILAAGCFCDARNDSNKQQKKRLFNDAITLTHLHVRWTTHARWFHDKWLWHLIRELLNGPPGLAGLSVRCCCQSAINEPIHSIHNFNFPVGGSGRSVGQMCICSMGFGILHENEWNWWWCKNKLVGAGSRDD